MLEPQLLCLWYTPKCNAFHNVTTTLRSVILFKDTYTTYKMNRVYLVMIWEVISNQMRSLKVIIFNNFIYRQNEYHWYYFCYLYWPWMTSQLKIIYILLLFDAFKSWNADNASVSAVFALWPLETSNNLLDLLWPHRLKTDILCNRWWYYEDKGQKFQLWLFSHLNIMIWPFVTFSDLQWPLMKFNILIALPIPFLHVY